MYIFDTSALIGAWVRTYPPDILPALWEKVDDLARAGKILIPEEVLQELGTQDDDLHRWVKERSESILAPTTRAVMLGARDVLSDHPHLTKSGTGRGRADPFVIALAAVRSWTVVTQEQGGSAAKPRIPYVCEDRDISCIPFLQVIRNEGWVFR